MNNTQVKMIKIGLVMISVIWKTVMKRAKILKIHFKILVNEAWTVCLIINLNSGTKLDSIQLQRK